MLSLKDASQVPKSIKILSLSVESQHLRFLQGIVGSTPWNGMVFFTMWLQLMGFSDFTASSLMAIFAGGCACGSYLGGVIGKSLGLGFL